MTDMHEDRSQPSPMPNDSVPHNAGGSFIEGLLLTAIGVYYRATGLSGVSDSTLFNASVDTAVWTLLAGGGLLLATGLIGWMGWRWAWMSEAAVNLLVGLSLLGCGGIWLANSEFMGILMVVFGVVSLSAARSAWQGHRWAATHQATARVQSARTESEPVVPPDQTVPPAKPASVSARRKEPPVRVGKLRPGEAPPEGFLAQLAREDEEHRQS